LDSVNADARLDVVPADTLMLPWVEATVAVAVTVEPFNPKDTLLEFENVTADMRLDVVPALTLMLLRSPAVDGTV
jgi:hypothetical protein